VSEIFEIKADIEHTREELAAAVDSLSARLDVTAMLRQRLARLRADDDVRRRVAVAAGGVLVLLAVRRRRRRRRRDRRD
jgi:Protein of unknown function (DUF3618)